MKTWKAYSKPMLPIIHGTFPSPHEKYDDFSFSSLPPQKNKGTNNHFNNSKAPRITKPSLIFHITDSVREIIAVRRWNLTPQMLASCMDCPSIINDREVVFTLPIDDIGMLSHFSLLHIPKKPLVLPCF